MKKFFVLFFSLQLMSLALLMIGCSTSNDPVNNDTKVMTDLVIADDFNFTTHRDVEVSFRAFYTGVFYIYDLEDNLLKKGLVKIDEGYQGTVSIPNDVNEVRLAFSEVEDLEAIYQIVNNEIIHDFYPETEEADRDGEQRCCWEDQIYPVLECVESLGDGVYLAHFGYLNDYDVTQQIPIGWDNRFENTSNWDMGQYTVFDPGRHENVFTVEFTEDTGWIRWRLSGTLGYGCATATIESYECPRGYGDDDDYDGVLDDDDDFPEDPTRAFRNFYPVADDSLAMGTLAFEDKWPHMGDYDFNDVILNYRFETVDNSSDYLYEVFGYFSLKASGAAYENGFAIELPFLDAEIDILTLTPELEGSSITDGDGSKIIKFFSNALEIMGKPENSTFVNTDSNDPYLSPVEFEFYLKLVEPLDESTLPWTVPYNPFIIVDQITGKEVHLPDMPPTILADLLLFGTGDDTSNAGSNRYYKTVTNLPWAINLPVEWTYPIERIAIIDAYNYVDDWAESSGSVYNDWYENTEGYIVEEKLYQTP
ncbi:MAG: LruC domain-containing protein [Candidatus Cloacimonetes bacterium]|nr:LruC domain-containing protein [Candidatus Cloacimonadota bacterium]